MSSQPPSKSMRFLQPRPAGDRPTPSTLSTFSNIPRTRRNVGQACDTCRQGRKKVCLALAFCGASFRYLPRRTQCNGARPICAACAAGQVHCTYNTLDRRRIDARNTELDKVRLEKDHMAATLQAMASAPEHVSITMLEDLRSSDRFSLDPQAFTSPNSGQCEPSPPGRSSSIISDSTLSAPSNLPPESRVREGASLFFANTSALFYIMTFDELETLLDRTYRSSEHVDVLTLCEICSLASVGSQYLTEQPQDVRQLYLTATMHIGQCLEVDKVRTIRILACLACYDIVEHREAARLSISKYITWYVFKPVINS